MKKRALGLFLLSVVLVLAPTANSVGNGAENEFRVTRLGEKAALFQIGKADPTNIIVLASRRGLVVIDTGVLPSRGTALRSAIEREFRRKDFAYVVNTHAHFDHSDGNQAFADVPILGHQNAAREMTRWYQSPAAVEAFLQSRAAYQKELETELKTAAAGSRDETRIREQLAENAALMDDFRKGRLILTRPTVLLNDRLTIDLGDLTLDLVYYGRAHTESDILVHVPELRLLMVGDLFFKTWLPYLSSQRIDVPRWLQALDSLQDGLRNVERVIGGHGEPMSGDELRAQVAYLRDIWDGVAAARQDGLSLAATMERLPFENRYPALTGLIRTSQGQDFHRANIEAAWRLQADSASRALESLIASRGLEAAVAEYRKSIAGNELYNVVENELNALGYRYLQSGRTAEAVAVFEINAEAFPRSWNVWDSLAEAHLSRDDRDKAEEFYKKSVELNPQNQNGRSQLSIIRGNRLEVAGETRETLRFEAGSRTGLQGPYLGQKPPGTRPEVFAPGIISSAKAIEFGATFSPDGKEIYFTRRVDGGQNTIMVSRWEKDGWTAPAETAFNKGFPSNEPHITPDGRKLYFGCNRARPGTDRAEYAIWVVERTAGGAWGEPRYHGPGMYVTTARNGNLYMTDVAGLVGRDRPVVVYPWTGNRYEAPQRLGGGVNTPVVADHAFVAPDESYILFDSPVRPGGQGGYGDLYICFKTPDGSWGEALNLGDDINTPATNFGPMVTPDGKYLFYCTRQDIYWVSAEILADLKARALGSRRSEEIFDPKSRLLSEGRIFSLAVHDFNNDGRPDIVVSDYLNPARILTNDAGLEFKKVVSLTSTAETAKTGHGVALGDFNGDGRLDLFLVYNEYPARLLFGDGKGGFADSGRAIGRPGLSGTSAQPADIDKDGDLDVFVTYYQEKARLYINDGAGVLTESNQVFYDGVEVGDLDGDGDEDVVSLRENGRATFWLNERGRFVLQDRAVDVGEGVARAILFDLDGDGDLDFFALGRQAKSTLWENDGRGSFRKLNQEFDSGSRLAIGDINLDGKKDLVVGSAIWLNRGDGRYENVQTIGPGTPSVLVLADIDGDGDLDLLRAGLDRATGRADLLIFFNRLKS